MQDTIVTSVQGVLLAASATSLTTATPKSIPVVATLGAIQPVTSAIFLNAGTWEITGTLQFIFASTTTGTNMQGGFSTTTNVLPTADLGLTNLTIAIPAGAPTTNTLVLTPLVVVVGAQGANYFLVAQAAFATSTLTAYGTITAKQIAP